MRGHMIWASVFFGLAWAFAYLRGDLFVRADPVFSLIVYGFFAFCIAGGVALIRYRLRLRRRPRRLR